VITLAEFNREADSTYVSDRVRSEIRSPFARYERVTVTFSLGADVDHAVTYRMRVRDPEAIDYEVRRKDRACDIYNDESITRRAWEPGVIYLRSSVADATVTLLLSEYKP
jgi:hypothetical protein